MMIPEYPEYEIETNTHLTNAIHQRVEEKVRKEIRQGKPPTDQQIENWVKQELIFILINVIIREIVRKEAL